jgi:hypothetical protein
LSIGGGKSFFGKKEGKRTWGLQYQPHGPRTYGMALAKLACATAGRRRLEMNFFMLERFPCGGMPLPQCDIKDHHKQEARHNAHRPNVGMAP